MPLPEKLNAALESLLIAGQKGGLSRAATELTGRYRSSERDSINAFMSTAPHRLAYLSFRMPATFAVVKRVLEETAKRIHGFEPKTLLDLGAGPGTASWAAVETFPTIDRVVMVEKDPDWQSLGKKLMHEAGGSVLQQAVWNTGDIESGAFNGSSDLVILSYVIGELSIDAIDLLVDRVWNATGQVAVFIEPGTPHGFKRIRAVRDRLIAIGAHLAAPCPHQRACPMKDGDWCHFSERLERSALHRSVKDVSMGYEDEKYSYVVASRSVVELPDARILRHPGRHTGHVDFEVCAKEGLKKLTISKRHKDLYKIARKLNWGDVLPTKLEFND